MLELNLTFLLYVAALHSQRLRRNVLIVQKKSWNRDVEALRSWLAERGMTL